MKKSLFTFLSILLLFSCQNGEKVKNLSDFIPNDAALIIQTSNLKQFQQDLKALSILKENSLSAKSSIQNDLGFLKYADSLTETLISISVSKNSKFTYTIISKQQPNFQLDSIKNKSIENIKAEGLNYQKLSLEGNEFFISEENTPFIISNSETQLKQILKKEKLLKNEGFEKAYKAIAPKKTSLIINHARLENFQQSLFLNLDLENVKNYAGWSAVDLEFSKSGISFNGLSIPDGKKNLHKILSNARTVSIEFAKVVPEKIRWVCCFGLSKSRKLSSEFKRIQTRFY